MHDRISFLDFSTVLKSKNYFVLDVHTNASAHQIIADTLIKHINQKQKGFFEKKWYYDNGNISIKAAYLNHYKHGVTTYYWQNGNMSMETNYKKGEKDDFEIRFNENGIEIDRKKYLKGVELQTNK